MNVQRCLQVVFLYRFENNNGKILFQMFFEDNIDDAKYCGHLYGLGTSFVVNGSGGYLDSNGDNSSSS